MRGLAFPSSAIFDRENSYDHGTPITYTDDIPIDPALAGPVIDPALMEDNMDVTPQNKPQQPYLEEPPLPQPTQHVHQYSDGPQGDPFAPPPLPMYFPIQSDQSSSPKPAKRKRKPRRERECGHCGKDKLEGEGELELLVTCSECGRSGHPSCMNLAGLGAIMSSYLWKCLECKTCEICSQKGDDARILFCDSCDRGWHMDCIQPPIQAAPDGEWYCPRCCPNDKIPELGYEERPPSPSFREVSVASSSRSHLPTGIGKGKGKGKGRQKAVLPEEYPSEEDIEVDIEATPMAPRTRGRPKKIKMTPSRPSQYSDDDLPTTSRHKRSRAQQSPVTHHLPRVRLRLPSQKGKGKDFEEENVPKGLFDDILTEEERETSKTSITAVDKQRFEKSRMVAEGQLVPPPQLPKSHASELVDYPSTPGPSFRPLRSNALSSAPASSTPLLASTSPAPSSATPAPISKGDSPPLRIQSIRFGQYEIKTWYDAPFPEEYATIPDGKLWICEFCLKYMKSRFACERHRLKCKSRHPPGDEIYRDGLVSVFEVDGRKNKIYCQNLCLLSKMFLDHKSLFYDVEPFLFYVMTEMDDFGARFVGYFSKEKQSLKDYNLSCIMTLPVRQRQGWGNLLIDFSYLLSKKEHQTGSPEKPLSGLGALGYKNYWTLSLMRYFETAPNHPRLEDITAATSMTIEDIVTTLKQQEMISARDVTPPPVKPLPGQSIKLNKGRKNGNVARRHLQRTQTHSAASETPKGPFVAPTHYEIIWDRDKVLQYLRAWESKGYLQLRPEKLQWSPYVLTRKNKAEKERLVAERSEKALGIVQETVDITLLGDDASAQSPVPDVVPFPSPLDIFDDDEVEEVPRPPERQRSQSPPAPEKDTSAKASPRKQVSRKRKRDSPQPVVNEPRSTRGRPRESSKDEGAAAIKQGMDRPKPGRALRSRPDESEKGVMSPLATTTPRKRKRAGSSDVLMDVVGRSPLNGNHTNGDEAASNMAALLKEVASRKALVIQEERAITDDIKWEDTGTHFRRSPQASDDTVYTPIASNRKDDMSILVDEDRDADGEYEEDAEGEPDEEGSL